MTTKLFLKKQQNKLWVVLVAVLIVWLFVWAAKPPEGKSSPTTSAPAHASFKASESSYNFGTISMAAGKVIHTFQVRNEGPDPLVVKKLYTSCMCTTASMIKDGQTYGPFGMQMHAPIPEINQTLAVGQEVPIEVTFDPAAHGPAGVGAINRTVYLENNAGKPMEINFSAFVTP